MVDAAFAVFMIAIFVIVIGAAVAGVYEFVRLVVLAIRSG